MIKATRLADGKPWLLNEDTIRAIMPDDSAEITRIWLKSGEQVPVVESVEQLSDQWSKVARGDLK